jgi:DNA-binding protein YbaB
VDPTLDEIVRLSTELQALVAPLAGAGGALQEEAEGADPNQAVTVVLDRAGRVSAVRPSTQWAERVPAEGFGAAVLQAVQAAQGVRLQRWAEAARSTPPSAAAPPAPTPPTPRAASGPPINVMSLLDEVTTAFDSLDRLAEQVAAQRAAPPAGSAAEGAASGDVHVTLSAQGEVAAVHADPGWVAHTNLNRLGERLLEAFQQAYEQHDAGVRPPAPIQLSPQMQAVAADPAGTLLRYVEDLRSSLS